MPTTAPIVNKAFLDRVAAVVDEVSTDTVSRIMHSHGHTLQ